MNRIFNEAVSPVSRVSGVSAVSSQCRTSCDIGKTNAVNKRPPKDIKDIKISFNGIFEPKPRSEDSVDSLSPIVSPVVNVNNNCSVSKDNDNNDHKEDNNKIVRRGRKRKIKEKNDPLRDKLDAALRIQKLPTTRELVQKFNIEIKSHKDQNREQTLNDRIVTTFRTKKFNKNVSDVEVDVVSDETQTKSELMHRFLTSQSTTSPPLATPLDESDYNYNTISVAFGDSTHSTHLSSSEHTSHAFNPLPNTSLTHNSVTDSIGDEIKDILSHLPPLYANDIVWSDSELKDHSSDNSDSDSKHNSDNRDERDEQHNQLIATNSELDSNYDNKDIKDNKRVKPITDYEVEKYLEQRWEYVNGVYDAETDWKEWQQMTSAVSYNGEVLHILPYVNIE